MGLLPEMGYVRPGSLKHIDQLVQPIRERGIAILLEHARSSNPTVLDAGCGPGGMTFMIGRSIAPHGTVVGVDRDPDMIRRATDMARTMKSNSQPTFLQGDAFALPFQNEEFDACWCERVLQHTKNPAEAILGLLRAIKPGGVVIFAEADWHSLSIAHSDRRLERRFVESLSKLIASPSIGRQLYSLLGSLGLDRVTAEVMPLLWTDFTSFARTTLSFPDLINQLTHYSGNDFTHFIASLNHQPFFATASVSIVYAHTPLSRAP
jgi:SAM-dependent methyltransferase